jgi:hypothetical protein
MAFTFGGVIEIGHASVADPELNVDMLVIEGEPLESNMHAREDEKSDCMYEVRSFLEANTR